MIRLLVVLQNLLVKRVTERKLFLHKKQVASVRSFRLEEEKGPRMLTLPKSYQQAREGQRSDCTDSYMPREAELHKNDEPRYVRERLKLDDFKRSQQNYGHSRRLRRLIVQLLTRDSELREWPMNLIRIKMAAGHRRRRRLVGIWRMRAETRRNVGFCELRELCTVCRDRIEREETEERVREWESERLSLST